MNWNNKTTTRCANNFAIMWRFEGECAKYSNKSVGTTQRSLSLQNNITERKSMTRGAGGLAFANKIKTSKGDVNFSCVESCWIETYFYYNS
jgi:hypothetical protein